MCRDWEVGDKLVCVDASLCKCGRCTEDFGLKLNEVYSIEAFEDRGPAYGIYVVIAGHASNIGYHKYSKGGGLNTKRFRKLNKPDEAKGNKADWEILMKQHCKPKQPVAPSRVPVAPVLPPYVYPRI